MKDSEATVRMECARTLVLMGDLAWSPTLIEGLDSDRKEVRYLCHEALKTSSGHDFGYDHLNQNDNDLKLSVLPLAAVVERVLGRHVLRLELPAEAQSAAAGGGAGWREQDGGAAGWQCAECAARRRARTAGRGQRAERAADPDAAGRAAGEATAPNAEGNGVCDTSPGDPPERRLSGDARRATCAGKAECGGFLRGLQR